MDASGVGVAGALLQNDQQLSTSGILLKHSHSFRKIRCYGKECLSMCFAFDRWDSLLYGKSDITVQTDHQPLESILKKFLNKALRRLQAMRVRLQRWSFVVNYEKGA